MTAGQMDRFARVLIKTNGHLGDFEVDVLERDFAKELSGVFEGLGCVVSLGDYDAILKVTCPPDVLERVWKGIEPVSIP